MFTLQACGCVLWTEWPPPVPSNSCSADRLCVAWEPRRLLVAVVMNISHALHRVTAVTKYYASFSTKGCCIPTEVYCLKVFSHLPPHPKFTSQGMVKIMIFQLVWTSIYIPYGSSLESSLHQELNVLVKNIFPSCHWIQGFMDSSQIKASTAIVISAAWT